MWYFQRSTYESEEAGREHGQGNMGEMKRGRSHSASTPESRGVGSREISGEFIKYAGSVGTEFRASVGFEAISFPET